MCPQYDDGWGKDPEDPTIYNVGFFVDLFFGVSGLDLIDEIGPHNHLGDQLSSVNIAGDQVSQSPLVCVRLVRSVLL